jgi:hypothetical protein
VIFWTFFPLILLNSLLSLAVIDQEEGTAAYFQVGIAFRQDPGPSNSVSRGWQLTSPIKYFWNPMTSQHHDIKQDTFSNSS